MRPLVILALALYVAHPPTTCWQVYVRDRATGRVVPVTVCGGDDPSHQQEEVRR